MTTTTLMSCRKNKCISCTVQDDNTQEIVEVVLECDRSTSYLDGFQDGLRAKYENAQDTVTVLCDFEEL